MNGIIFDSTLKIEKNAFKDQAELRHIIKLSLSFSLMGMLW
jgi:hypothetical protein